MNNIIIKSMNLISVIKNTYNKENNTFYKNDTNKHFPSSVREWDNSIFVYNKNALSLIPLISKLAIKFIRNYFSLYNTQVEKNVRKKKMNRKYRKLSSNRIFISKGEFKHTNNKVIITLYTFNKQKKNYLLKLKKRYINKYLNKNYQKKYSISRILRDNKPRYIKVRIKNTELLMNKLNNIKIKSIIALKKASDNKQIIIKVLDKLYKMKKIQGVSKYNNRILKYIKIFYIWRIRKFLRKMEKYIYYKNLIYINKSKFNYTYLQYLKNYLQVLFNKNVEFNFINLKKFHLNSNILSESLMLKIMKKRQKLSNYLNKITEKIKIKNEMNLNQSLKNSTKLHKHIINNLEHKHITGFRLEIKGRLTKRNTASRSISKLKYKGNLLHSKSSLNNLSSVFLKGNLSSNLQYTNLNNKTKIGSFGIKGWVSGN